jgi:hypothetical protein
VLCPNLRDVCSAVDIATLKEKGICFMKVASPFVVV